MIRALYPHEKMSCSHCFSIKNYDFPIDLHMKRSFFSQLTSHEQRDGGNSGPLRAQLLHSPSCLSSSCLRPVVYICVYILYIYTIYICIMYQINLMTCICVAMILYNYIYIYRERERVILYHLDTYQYIYISYHIYIYIIYYIIDLLYISISYMTYISISSPFYSHLSVSAKLQICGCLLKGSFLKGAVLTRASGNI